MLRPFGENTMNQRDRIKEHLNKGFTLTRLDAWDALGILEAPARISELRAEGYQIKTRMLEVVNRYGEKVRIAKWSKG